jgi:hypothetical protein
VNTRTYTPTHPNPNPHPHYPCSTHLLEEGQALRLAGRLDLRLLLLRLGLLLLLGHLDEAGRQGLELVAHAGVALQARLPEVQALALVVHAHLCVGRDSGAESVIVAYIEHR